MCKLHKDGFTFAIVYNFPKIAVEFSASYQNTLFWLKQSLLKCDEACGPDCVPAIFTAKRC